MGVVHQSDVSQRISHLGGHIGIVAVAVFFGGSDPLDEIPILILEFFVRPGDVAVGVVVELGASSALVGHDLLVGAHVRVVKHG